MSARHAMSSFIAAARPSNCIELSAATDTLWGRRAMRLHRTMALLDVALAGLLLVGCGSPSNPNAPSGPDLATLPASPDLATLPASPDLGPPGRRHLDHTLIDPDQALAGL